MPFPLEAVNPGPPVAGHKGAKYAPSAFNTKWMRKCPKGFHVNGSGKIVANGRRRK